MQMHRIFLAGTVLVLSFIPGGAFAQDQNGRPASFEERYRLEETAPPQPAAAPTPASQATPAPQSSPASQPSTVGTVSRQPNVTRPIRTARTERPRARVVVLRRSYLDAGTEVLPGERKFLDYAYPPTYQPTNVVTNIGGRVGWHNSPLPGPFFPTTN
jgi:hypothetical protein